jgi:hypothetical protein
VPFNAALLRLERFQAEIAYHAAYNYWNLRGVLAERWAHGPVFGAANEATHQVTLTPAVGKGDDTRLWAVYGLRASGLNAEGETRVREARNLVQNWITDCVAVLQPKRTVRANVSLTALYPVDDIGEASKRLRAAYYREGSLEDVFPASLHEYRQSFHSALDFLVPLDDEGSGVSVIIGAIGPPHRGTFFVDADEERDDEWWMGMKYERRRVELEGLKDPVAVASKMARRSVSDLQEIAAAVLPSVVA